MFPVVDISYAVENKDDLNKANKDICTIADKLLNGFQQYGFIYIKGHGFTQTFIDETFKLYRQHFFDLSVERKSKLFLNTIEAEGMAGYLPFESETPVIGRPADLKEALEYKPYMADKLRDKLHADLFQRFEEIFSKCFDLTLTLLRILSIALNIHDAEFFTQHHKYMGEVGNLTILRSIYYPGVENRDKIKPLQQRCAKHTDFGTLTLLFQDDTGGLEVQSPNGEFIPVTPMKDTIIINAADLLERWSSGRIKSAVHRVVVPDDASKARQSIAFFCNPDNDVVVECLDGSDKYKPVTSLQYIDMRGREMRASYLDTWKDVV